MPACETSLSAERPQWPRVYSLGRPRSHGRMPSLVGDSGHCISRKGGTVGGGWDSGRWVGQWGMGGVTRRVTCTWWLLWKSPGWDWVGHPLP